ncbi:MAG: haloacid dehalogenase type II [Chloroflexota bacterium]
MATLALDQFDVLSFDCYGTLIDWEAGILAALRTILAARGVDAPDDALLERYALAEAAAEEGPYLRYREVLAHSADVTARELGVEPTPGELAVFGGSVADWPAFPDSAAALARLAGRYRLAILTNCDDDLFAASNRRLGVTFDEVVTAQQVGGYKPGLRNFEILLGRVGAPRERVLHVAQSLFHDHVPARQMGLSTVWINRRHDRPGSGATPPAAATPDLTVPSMEAFADLVAEAFRN